MLFDLRGRGRRRTVQVIYLSLALLMGGGLVLFGIGGATSGGLVDAIQGGSGGQSADDVFEKRVDALEKRTQANPRDARAWNELASLRFAVAGSTGYDQNQRVYATKGKTELRNANAAWQRYLALNPPKPDADTAVKMVQALGDQGLRQYPEAVRAMEIVIDNRPATYQLYAQLAVLAHGAKQTRKATLSTGKAVELAPKNQRKAVRDAIKQEQARIDGVASAGQPTGQ
jgi:tetratricopeptide (TPR) repeat protein